MKKLVIKTQYIIDVLKSKCCGYLRRFATIFNFQFSIFKCFLPALILFNACSNFLDVVPEGVATIDMAFNSRVEALKYLKTCYSYMPKNGDIGSDPGILGGDEMWTLVDVYQTVVSDRAFSIAQGLQNASGPLLDRWGGLFQALRDCNIFLENIGKVADLQEWERDQWIAEAKFLKAYYHFYLVQMYGPIPLVKENLPVDVDISKVKVVRDPVDNCFQYIVQLLDEATAGDFLPARVIDPANDLGRITKPIAMSFKAKVLVTAASPLFNGNNDQATLHNHDGTVLFNTSYDAAKWQKAVVACKEAIASCSDAGIELYYYPISALTKLSDTIITQLSLRNAFTERWNTEIIWANTQSIASGGNAGLQTLSIAKLNPAFRDAPFIGKPFAPPLKIAEMFYTENGVPLAEDNTRDFSKIYDLRVAQPSDKLYIKAGSTTVDMHFDREPRFYAYLGFDCGIWYGQGRIDDKGELWTMNCKKGDVDGGANPKAGPYTGYIPKKYVYYTNTLTNLTSYSVTTYPWPIMRLSDLYLLYAEAINEAEGPAGPNSSEMFTYIDLVRARAGLKPVKESWDNYTNNPKYNSQTGMRQIIQQERMIELAFEGHRFWDVRRWKTAPNLYRTPIKGWSMQQYETVYFYRPTVLFNQKFGIRDYFWPIKNSDIINNRNLVQNIGW